MKLSVIFPVYNERATVREILDRVLGFSMAGLEVEVLIVEGNSTDGTREIIREYEKRPHVRVFYEERPRGKGAAVRTGLKHVRGDIVLIQDGDLEYKVEDYPKVLAPILEGKAEIVFGSRAMEVSTRWQYRKFGGCERFYGFFVNMGGVLFTGLFNFLYGTHLSDGATMFKVYRADLLKDLNLKSDGFDYDWEMQGKLAKRGHKFYETPISYKARSREEGKKIVFWRDGIKVLLAILRYRFCD
ncbi:MAG: glycosyltransferase family 2 protein [Elusimicrobiota bacterium]